MKYLLSEWPPLSARVWTGVVGAAVAVHEPLGIGQIAALLFTLAGVVLATRT